MKQQIYQFDEFQLDSVNRELRRGGESVPLPAKAFDLLLMLVENNGRLVEKDEIFARVWHDQIVEESNLTVHISAIRKALGETKNKPRFINTVSGYGYRFSGEVFTPEDEMLIETQTVSRITIENLEVNAEPFDETDYSKSTSPKNKTFEKQADFAALPQRRAAASVFLTIGLIAILSLAAFGIYRYSSGKSRPAFFEKVRFSRATNSGKITGAAISRDGKYIAYVAGDEEGKSLWLQQIGTASHIRILPPVKAEVYGLTYSPDGAFIYYNLYTGETSDIELFRIPSLGGVAEKIPNVIAASVRFSPDGKQISYIQSDSASNANYLFVANSDGSQPRIVLKKEHPDTFEFFTPAAWSPDGETIACLVYHHEPDETYASIVGISARDGGEKSLSSRRWYELLDIEWLKDGTGLLVSAGEKVGKNNQIWFLSYPSGESRQITNDLTSYTWLSATADSKSLVALQSSKINSISIGEIGADAKDFKEIAAEIGVLNPLVWTPGGNLIFRSDKDGGANLWTMDSDGNNRRQLTANADVDSRGMCISPDGRFLVFGSWRGGKSNLWRVDANGGNLTQLTNGEADLYPACSPDGRSVIYQRGLHSKPVLWKTPIEGGEAVQLTDFRAKWAAISRDGSRIAFLRLADNKWRIGIVSPEGGVLREIDAPANLTESTLYWSRDNQSLYYIGATGGSGNLWQAPLDGSPARQITNFTSNLLADFALSPDGKRLALVRTSVLSDVVLIENATAP